MLADEHGHALAAVLIEQRQHVPVPEREDHRTPLATQPFDARFAIDDADTPRSAKQPHERHAETHDPAYSPLASTLCPPDVLRGPGWRSLRHAQLASRCSA